MTADSAWSQIREKIAQEDFAGASGILSRCEHDWQAAAACGTPLKAADRAALMEHMQSVLVLARVKRAHLESQFNALSEKRSQRSAAGSVGELYQRQT
jgi:hypothetical protein